MLPDARAIESAARIVYATMPATPQRVWPQLSARLGAEAWVKHENHALTGAFKVRGGLVYFERLGRDPHCRGVVGATRGNHGQSMALAAARTGLACRIYVPHGNSARKNEAMRALGAQLVEHGHDFQAAREQAARAAAAEGLHYVPSFHTDLVRGVATYWAELFSAAPDLDVVYVPIGQGSGINACAAARNAYAPRTRIVGVVSAHAPCYALSLEAGRLVQADVSTQIADGLACRSPDPESFEIIRAHVERIVRVTDAQVADAMRLVYASTSNVAEGAAAAAFAAAFKERAQLAGRKVGLPLTGSNVDAELLVRVLGGESFEDSGFENIEPEHRGSEHSRFDHTRLRAAA
ncbi:MAG: threonine dehydratase [Burkholderiales bacterium]|jgi:threonine dehydratase|nr:threonine dehydratase [Burkholderiales bacterium]